MWTDNCMWPRRGGSVATIEARVTGLAAPWVEAKRIDKGVAGRTSKRGKNNGTEIKSMYTTAFAHLSKIVHKDINTNQF